MQQQAALMAAAAAQGGATYINPMAALAAAHMQQASPALAVTPNGLTSAAITPTTTGRASYTVPCHVVDLISYLLIILLWVFYN